MASNFFSFFFCHTGREKNDEPPSLSRKQSHMKPPLIGAKGEWRRQMVGWPISRIAGTKSISAAGGLEGVCVFVCVCAALGCLGSGVQFEIRNNLIKIKKILNPDPLFSHLHQANQLCPASYPAECDWLLCLQSGP